MHYFVETARLSLCFFFSVNRISTMNKGICRFYQFIQTSLYFKKKFSEKIDFHDKAQER